MKTSKSMRKKRATVLRILPLCLIVSAIIIFSAKMYLQRLGEGLLDVCAKQQDSYVELVLGQIFLDENRTDEEILEFISSLDVSAQNYWTLSRNQHILFVKDVMETNRYKGIAANSYFSSDSAAEFLEALTLHRIIHHDILIDDKEYIASGTLFQYQGKEYKICLLTNKDVILDQNIFVEARVNIMIVVAMLCIFTILLGCGLSYRIDQSERNKKQLQQQLIDAEYRLSVKEQREQEEPDGTGSEKMNIKTSREYCLKFYLNARHYIIIDGVKGEIHPHTWEFALTIRIPHASFVEFNAYEYAIKEFLEPFQNKVLNDEPAFLTLLPTLENMTDLFSDKFFDLIQQAGGVLLQVEASETPTRSYVINIIRDENE